MADSTTTNLALVKPEVGASADTWGGKLNDNFDAISALFPSNDLAIANGGTGASTAADARTNLGLVIGTDVQAHDAGLDDIAGLAVTDGNIIVGDGTNWVAESGSTARTSLGLGSIATQNADAVAITGGSSSVEKLTIAGYAIEKATISASAPTSTTNFDVLTQSVVYYTSNSTTNFTLNVRGNSSTSLDSSMATGQAVTIALMVTNGATAYYPSAITVDGNSITPKWQNGAAPSAGYASAVDVYVLTIIKTASATFTVLGSQTKFA